MSWRDQLKPASFRGVPFFVESNELVGGRNSADHEYPNRDGGWSEDLGLGPDEFSVTAYLIGDDYLSARDALIVALNKAGAGTLILPTHKARQVIAKKGYRVRWSNAEGGTESIDINFKESGKNKYPNQSVDTAASVEDAAAKVITSLTDNFKAIFNTNDLPEFVAQSAQKNSQSLVTMLQNAGTLKNGDPSAVAKFQSALSDFTFKINSLVRSGGDYGVQFGFLVAQISDIYPDAAFAYSAYKSLLGFGFNFVPVKVSTSTRKQQAQNQALQIALVRRSALAGMAVSASAMEFASYDDAVSLRNEISDLLEDELIAIGDTNDHQAYDDIYALKTEIVRDLTTRAANLERIKTFTFQSSLPSLVASYRIYKTVDQADDIVARNKIKHPGFLPAGQPLQILV